MPSALDGGDATPPSTDAPAVATRVRTATDDAAHTQRSIGAATRGSALSLAGTALGAVANFAMLIIVARRFDDTTFGVFAGVTSLFIIGGVVLRLGAGVGATYWVSRARAFHRQDLIGPLTRVAVVPAGVASIAVAAAAMLAARPLAEWLTDPEGVDDFTTMLRIAALALPFWVCGQVLLGVTRGLGTMRPTVFYAQVGRQVGQLITVGIVAVIDTDPVLLMAAWSLPYVAVLIGPGLWLARRPASAADPARWLPPEGRSLDNPGRAFWRYALPQSFNSVAQAGLEKFDIIAIGVIAGANEQGTYLVVNRIAHVVALAIFSFGMALAPQLATAFANKADHRARELVATVTSWMLLLVGPFLWVVLWFPDPILGIFGDNVTSGSSGLRIIAGGLLVIVMLGPTENLLLMSGGSTTALIDNAIGLALNIVLNLVLIPEMGIEGAAIAWVSSVFLVRLLALIQVWRRRRVTAMGAAVLTAVAIIGVAFGAVGGVCSATLGSGWLGLIVTLAAGTALGLALIAAVRDALRIDQLQMSLRRPTGRT